MVRRHEKSSFGSAYAFPGGVFEPDDRGLDAYCKGTTDESVSQLLGVESGGLPFYVAAIRELFEESGVLLADTEGLDENLADVRDGLNDGSVSWGAFVREHDLRLRTDRLHYFAHWVTPPQMPKRYSTRFFLAVLPEGQSATHCGGELTESCWNTASDVLAAGRNGDIKLHYPTIKTLESLDRHKSLDELVDWAASSADWGVTSMIPVMIERDGRKTVVLPGDRDYPGSRT